MQKKRNSLTIKIFIALLAGAITGVILNLIKEYDSAGIAQKWLTDGIFSLAGKMFISAIKMLVVPLVLTSLICGAAGIDDIRKLGRVGVKTLVFYISTTTIAIAVAISLSFITGPGKGFELAEGQDSFEASEAPGFVDTISSIIPDNPFAAFTEGNMLQVIFFAILFGFAMSVLGDRVSRIRGGLEELNEIIMKMVTMVIYVAPYGVFALVANVFAKEGFDAFLPLLKYIITVILALMFHFLFVYSSALKFIGKLSPVNFVKKFYSTMLVAFSTASSNATLPVTLETAEKKMGVSGRIASFTLPLGATVNMDGTAIMQGVAVVFISQAYGVDLTFVNIVTVILTATLASIGTAGVPSVGLITLSMVLQQVNLPVEGIALILGVDRILDMLRTAVNVSGDTIGSMIIAKSEGELNEDVFNEV
ncbi:MAG: dicarboxylate/amino acid:cation symporter [bacterium]